MKRFFIRLLIFLIPFILLVSLEVLIDPFNYFYQTKNKRLFELKESISLKINPYLYKLVKYDRNPCPVVVFGDSRAELLRPEFFNEYSSEKVANLAIGGGTIQDAVEIYNYISKKHQIKKIYWGVSIETYNGTRLRNRAKASIEIKNSFLLYLLNSYTFSSTMLICRSIIFNEKIELYKPTESKEAFWSTQIDLDTRYLESYSYPANYYKELEKISHDCQQKQIQLTFVIPPGHTDLQNIIKKFNLTDSNRRFRNDMESLGSVFNFNYPNDITENKDNYKDPFHFNESISKLIVKEIMTKNTKHAEYLPYGI